MKIKNYIASFHYRKTYSLFEIFIVLILWFLSVFYTLIVLVRNFLYKVNILKSYKAAIKVISIGNLTTGGTGKTPIVSSIIDYISKNNSYNSAILTRGYGRISSKHTKPIIISCEDTNIDPKHTGDEPLMLSRISSKARVYISSNRVNSAKMAEKNDDVIILDDGYQHLRLCRDLNVLLIDYDKWFGNNKLLPLGPLREPLTSLNRADIFIITIKSSNKNIDKNFIDDHLSKYNKPIIFATYEFSSFVDLRTKILYETLKYSSVLTFCGIGQPYSFQKNVESLKFKINEFLCFEDHHIYTESDIEKINQVSARTNSEALITTEKDAVKLERFLDRIDYPIFYLKMEMKFDVEKLLRLGGIL